LLLEHTSFKEKTFAMHPTAETIIKDEGFCDIL